MTWAMWITGLPGSGKSALARATAAALAVSGERATVLELDEIREVLTPRPRYTEAEREVVYRALVYMARLLTDAGVAVIIDATAHRRAWRELARRTIRHFAEVQLVCPVEVCRERERSRVRGHAPRGIYARAGRPGATVPGVDVAYEPALHPECVVDTSREDLRTAVARVVGVARRLARARHAPPPPERLAAWTLLIWAAGEAPMPMPRAVASALAARSIRVKVLDVAEISHHLLDGVTAGKHEAAIVERAVAYMARLLNQAAVAVVIDACPTTPEIRVLARELLCRYAEVRLLGSGDRPAGDDVTQPELTLHPDRQDAWTLLEEMLFLARRLHRTAAAFPPRRGRRTTCKSES